MPGQIHRGFALVAASLLPHIKAALTSLVKDSSNGANIKNVYVSGHSLGAGVAALVSYAAQVRRSGLFNTGCMRVGVGQLQHDVGTCAHCKQHR